jgi:hypothetical protein
VTVPRGYTGHPRDFIKGTVVPDPNVRHGHFRVLPQTTGGFVVIDETRRLGEQVITKPMSLEAADAKARTLWQHHGRPFSGAPDGGRRT